MHVFPLAISPFSLEHHRRQQTHSIPTARANAGLAGTDISTLSEGLQSASRCYTLVAERLSDIQVTDVYVQHSLRLLTDFVCFGISACGLCIR